MKRVFRVFTVLLAVLLLFCSCSNSKKVALNIGNGQVGSDVYAYFLDYVMINDAKNKKMSDDDIKKRANEFCLEYVKINTKFEEMNLSLDAGKKAQIANDVTNKWAFFGNYYKSIGVSKQTLTKIEENSAFKDALLLAIYDENGTKPVDEDDIKAYFKENYVFFKAINGYLKTTDSKGKDISKSPKETEDILQNFKSMAKSITSENTIDDVNRAYLQENEDLSPLPVSVVNKSSKDYPDVFFEKVVTMKTGDVKVLTFDDYIFIVQRFDNFDESQEFYVNYRSACLRDMVIDDFNKDIDKWYKDSKVTANNRIQDKCYKTIVKVREKNKAENM